MKLPQGLCRRLAFTFLAVTCCAQFAFSQASGSITGTVRDRSDAVISGAEVVVSSAATGFRQATVSNSDGDYLVAALPAGNYNVSIKAAGFQKFQAKQVVLRVGARIRVDATLMVGAVTSEVVVEGNAAGAVETQSSELAGTITGEQISQLQLNGRNFTQLITLIPGVSNQTGQDEGTVGPRAAFPMPSTAGEQSSIIGKSMVVRHLTRAATPT